MQFMTVKKKVQYNKLFNHVTTLILEFTSNIQIILKNYIIMTE